MCFLCGCLYIWNLNPAQQTLFFFKQWLDSFMLLHNSLYCKRLFWFIVNFYSFLLCSVQEHSSVPKLHWHTLLLHSSVLYPLKMGLPHKRKTSNEFECSLYSVHDLAAWKLIFSTFKMLLLLYWPVVFKQLGSTKGLQQVQRVARCLMT